MRRTLLAPALLVTACAPAPGATPAPVAPGNSAANGAPSAVPATAPAAAGATVRFDIVQADHLAGKAIYVRHADGSYDEDLAYEDRGRGPKLHLHTDVGADGIPTRVDNAGTDYWHRAVRETLACDAARCAWKSDDEHGEAARAFYVAVDAGMHQEEVLLRALTRAPHGEIPLLPAGLARAKRAADATLTRAGETRHVVAWEVSGLGMSPAIAWFDDDGVPFAIASDWQSTVREGWYGTVPALLAIQRSLAQARREAIAKSVAHRPDKGLAIVHARLFDPQKRAVRDDVTIVIEAGRVKAVGPRLAPPAGAEVIDARGKTVLPGLWDMHVHLSDDDGLLHVAEGITTVRDLGNELESSLTRRGRYDEGRELGPRVILAGMIDGPGPFQGPTKALVDDDAEARAAVDVYAARGFAQIKIYSSVRPALVPVIVAEAHAKGMRVSGHVPAHMIAEDAVRAGFDELQHVNFLMLDLVGDRDTDTRTPVRFSLVGEKGAGVDLDGPRTKALIDLLVARRTVVDPTLATFEAMFTARHEQPSESLAPVLARLPPQVQRSAFGGALPMPEGMADTYRASFARCKELVKRLWDRKVTIVAGTDGFAGFDLHRELEMYSEAGIPNADVLAIATLGAARVMKREKQSGSIAPGKDADVLIVDGDPLARMRDVRNTVTVIKDGVVIDAVAAQSALSIAPASK